PGPRAPPRNPSSCNPQREAAAMSDPTRAPASRLFLAAYAVISFGLVTTVNRAAGRLAPGWPGLADSCIASLGRCRLLFLAMRPARPLAAPRAGADGRRMRRLALGWLVIWWGASAVAALVAGHWVRYRLAGGAAQLVGFLALGPLQEELLFRGAIFE